MAWRYAESSARFAPGRSTLNWLVTRSRSSWKVRRRRDSISGWTWGIWFSRVVSFVWASCPSGVCGWPACVFCCNCWRYGDELNAGSKTLGAMACPIADTPSPTAVCPVSSFVRPKEESAFLANWKGEVRGAVGATVGACVMEVGQEVFDRPGTALSEREGEKDAPSPLELTGWAPRVFSPNRIIEVSAMCPPTLYYPQPALLSSRRHHHPNPGIRCPAQIELSGAPGQHHEALSGICVVGWGSRPHGKLVLPIIQQVSHVILEIDLFLVCFAPKLIVLNLHARPIPWRLARKSARSKNHGSAVEPEEDSRNW